ncbi:hypothetical protein SPRG_04347 [Saprolegnia parasitica CBS 223.65]|uniref:Pyridoxal-dependent decarboxylase n=1 Tax=Saprolegnia parasitica (strain CBS 223.65) TaxID=695850 RepID=A0A067CMH6_SAPPC|nr:hypothetical protein SPRG_04347 [Saprolegnia parasitica CBS 223.65]KDO30445.1 hypothetical protein SPRG_04347 [Saprolegnia parasitica CBS 223.65]|eukprot:XP_012198667.1 hypothetical protein SPRG_04347 [Saprolegnia parasitica CBS 223.65]
MASPLHLDPAVVEAAAIASVKLGLAHHKTFANEPADARGDLTLSAASPLVQASLAFDERSAPARGTDITSLLSFLQTNLVGVASGFNANTDTFLAYVLGGVLPQANVLDFYINAVDPTTISWSKAPLIQRLEMNVVHWFCDLVGYARDSSLGIFTQGASGANFDAAVIARVKKFPRNRDIARGTVYVSSGAHFCNARGARMAGILPEHVRQLPVDATGRLRLDALAAALAADVANGLVPFLMVASLGTTSLGAVDDLNGMADLADSYGCHLHCDGALGGFFCSRSRAHSVSLDFHKGMALPYATSMLLVKDKNDLINGFSANDDMEYLKKTEVNSRFGIGTQDEFDLDLITFADCSPDLSRACKGLKVWWLLKLHGLDAWKAHFDHLLNVADAARRAIATIRGLELAPGDLNVVNFRANVPGDADTVNAATDALLAAVNARRAVFLSMATYTTTDGVKYATARACFMNHNVTLATVQTLVDELRAVLLP